jgi:hypothetical protein
VPRSARLSRPSTSDRTLSSSARSASLNASWFAYLAGRYKGVVVSSVQIPCRSGSPHGVFGDEDAAGGVPEAAEVCAEAGVIGAETTTLQATTAMATLIIESENFSRMMISFCLEPDTGVGRIGVGLWPQRKFQATRFRVMLELSHKIQTGGT